MTITREQAAEQRAAQVRGAKDRPSQRRMSEEPVEHLLMRAPVLIERQDLKPYERNGLSVVTVTGYASVTERSYEVWDAYGPYMETVARGAFGKTLAAGPDLIYAPNHMAGSTLPMARTTNDTLDLVEDETGLHYDAHVDPTRTDVADALKAIQRGDLSQASFKFRIVRGQWSPDFTEYRVEEVDLHGGDVSSVAFGANPSGTSALRSTTAPGRNADALRARLSLAIAG